MEKKNLYTYTITPEQATALEVAVAGMSSLQRVTVPYTSLALKGKHLTINLYTSGKLVVQGKDAEEFVLFTLEPLVLGAATLGYEEVLDPKMYAPHMGTDESGKGDIFGPLITVGAFVDETSSRQLSDLGIRDSKTIADGQIQKLAVEIRKILGRKNCSFVLLRPLTYNRLYTKLPNVNRLLAWCHARAIETLAEQRPDATRVVVDQFAKTESTIQRALMPRGRKLVVEQMHKAERDIAVATASVLARDVFITEMKKLAEVAGCVLPKGAGPKVPEMLDTLLSTKGVDILPHVSKCHFKTIEEALTRHGLTREDLPAFDEMGTP
jgi:ribonuclease HIII